MQGRTATTKDGVTRKRLKSRKAVYKELKEKRCV